MRCKCLLFFMPLMGRTGVGGEEKGVTLQQITQPRYGEVLIIVDRYEQLYVVLVSIVSLSKLLQGCLGRSRAVAPSLKASKICLCLRLLGMTQV